MQANLVDYYYDNISRIYQRIKQLLDIVDTVFMPDDNTMPSLEIKRPETEFLNRTVYLWTLDSIDHLQVVLDYLVGTYNDYNLTEYSTGDPTPKIKLWRPKTLLIDDYYWQQLKDDFDRVNKLLDQLQSYSADYAKG